MLPLQDDIPSRTTPFVNYAIIALCGLVFLVQLADQPGKPSMVERFGMIPVRVLHPGEPVIMQQLGDQDTPNGPQEVVFEQEAAPSAVPAFLTVFTCIFLHGGWMHLIGNMWFLYIFGDNIEDRFGHVGYALFYVASGIAAGIVHLISGPSSPIPTIGASGAIAGVLGAYFLWYRNAKVKALVPLGGFIQIMVLPAPIFLGFWFVIQLFQGVLTNEGSGVAWWAHIGGFIVGLALAFVSGQLNLIAPLNDSRDDSTKFRPNFGRRYRY
ncbi:MAG: rhomboid family intramembrane serine protease [Planctomycetaceae bacterium]|nr:rhomboid family intramembrane serine protease [Planctomycetaceae bacterium]